MPSFFERVTHRSNPWPQGREDLHWHFLPDPDQMTQRLFEPYRDLTHRDGLAPVRPDWYHMTIQHGPVLLDVSDSELTAIVDLVERCCASSRSFELLVDRPTVGNVALECPMRVGAPARHLWQITTAATRKVLGGRAVTIPEIYYPHMSIAYGTGEFDRTPLKVWLSDCPEDPFTVRVDRISLVAQSHNGSEITWRHLLDVPLAASSRPAAGR